MYSNTLWEIRHYLATAVGDNIYGQCGTTGATTTKIYANFLYKADDYYNNHYFEVYIYAGTNIGVAKRVTDWDLSDYLLTVHSAYDAACDATSYAELHRIFTEDEYRKAINIAIEKSPELPYLIPQIDETVTLVADKYEYSIPAGFTHIHKFTTEDTADTGEYDEYAVIDPRDWRLIPGRKLKFDESHYSPTAGKDLRIEGHGRQPLVDDDNDVIYLPPEWVINKAITCLPQERIRSENLDRAYERAERFVKESQSRSWAHPESKRVIE